jgi:hypothetical protein
MNFFLIEKKKWGKGWSANLLMLLSMIVILIPIGVLVNLLSSKVNYVIQHSNEMVAALNACG